MYDEFNCFLNVFSAAFSLFGITWNVDGSADIISDLDIEKVSLLEFDNEYGLTGVVDRELYRPGVMEHLLFMENSSFSRFDCSLGSVRCVGGDLFIAPPY